MRRAAREWQHEKERGPGGLTRAVISASALRDSSSMRYAVRAWRETTYPEQHPTVVTSDMRDMAQALKSHAIEEARRGKRRTAEWKKQVAVDATEPGPSEPERRAK